MKKLTSHEKVKRLFDDYKESLFLTALEFHNKLSFLQNEMIRENRENLNNEKEVKNDEM